MKKFLTAIFALALCGCDTVTQPDPDLRKPMPGTEFAECVKYRLWPSMVNVVREGTTCPDGRPAEIVAAQWISTVPGTCPVTQDGSGIVGGLQAVRYLWGCRK